MTDILRVGPACYHVQHNIPPTIAHTMNWFYDEGLHDEKGHPTYELVDNSFAPFMFEKLTLGQAMRERGMDVCMDIKPSTVAYLRQHGYDIHIICGWRNQNPDCVVAQKSIKSLRDLAGKRIGVIDFSDILVTVLSYWLQEEGMDPDKDVTWVRGYYPRRCPAAIRSGEIDAGFVRRDETRELAAEGYPVVLDIKKQYPNGRPDRTIAATGTAIKEKPELIKSYLKGMLRAYWFCRKQPENLSFIQGIERRLRRQSTDPDERARTGLTYGTAEQAEGMPFPYDGIPSGIDQYLHEAVSLGILDEAPDGASLCNLDLVRAAFKELSERESLRADLERALQVRAKHGY